jgi:hypothetical protein
MVFNDSRKYALYRQIKEKLIQKQPKRAIVHNEDIHHFHDLLDFIDCPANRNDYKIPQVQPKPVEPNQSLVELPKPQLAPATSPPPPPIEAIEEELELELTGWQTSKLKGIHAMTEGNVSMEICTSKQCYSDIECNEGGHNRETEIKHRTIQKQNSIPKPKSNHQVCILPLLQSDNMNQSTYPWNFFVPSKQY